MDRDFSLLIVDDEAIMRNALAETLAERGYRTETAVDGESALEKLTRDTYDAVLTDLRMPGMDGLEFLRRAREMNPQLPVIVMTAYGTIETAVTAMKEGAADYVTKPFSFDEIGIVLERVQEKRRLEGRIRLLETELADVRRAREFHGMIGKSDAMRQVYDRILKVAPSPATVLITGESGTGKERVAAAIHQAGPRRDRPFIQLNCAAMPESLLESELFGHEKGAFTGAHARKIGHFEMAAGGTLFLDEIGEIPPAVQAKLLRAIQDKAFNRVGGVKPIQVDVRIIAATNRDLEEAVEAGNFRSDLYFRLNVIPVHLPPLRRRREDIPLLARHFLERFARENHSDFKDFSPEALKRLSEYSWPGNVRELMNVIERTVVLNRGDVVEPSMLPTELDNENLLRPGTGTAGNFPGPDRPLRDLEAFHIARVLEHVEGNLSQAARILEIDRKTLYNKMERYGLDQRG